MNRALFVLLPVLLLVTPARAVDHVIAVAYFDSHAVDPDLEPLGRGVADMLMTDLSRGQGVRIVERARLTEVLAELELQRSGYIDETTAQELGHGLGATAVVVGAMTSALEGMRLDARVVDVEAGEVIVAVETTGATDQFFELERRLAAKILDGLDISYDPEALQDRQGMTLDDVVSHAASIDEQDQRYLDHLDALRQYRIRRLYRSGLTYVGGSADSGISTTVVWTVYDGGGGAHNALSFAAEVGDVELHRQILHRSRAALAAGIATLGGGAAMMTVGLIHSMVSMDFSSDSPDYAHGFVGGLVLAGVGVLLMTAGPAICFPIVNKAAWIHAYYTPERVDELIDDYNARLGEDLDLDPADIKRMELQSLRRPTVEAQIRLAVGYVGISGRF